MDRFDEIARAWHEIESEGWDLLDAGGIPSLAALLRRVAAESAAERDALAAQVERLSKDANSLFGALPKTASGRDEDRARLALAMAVVSTPAASLAEHDQRVRAEALGSAEDAAHDAIHSTVYEMGECARIKDAVCAAIRALGEGKSDDATGQ